MTSTLWLQFYCVTPPKHGAAVGNSLETGGPDTTQSERPGTLGGLAQRLQKGVRATIEALGQSHAQRLAALVETSDDAILSVDLDGYFYDE